MKKKLILILITILLLGISAYSFASSNTYRFNDNGFSYEVKMGNPLLKRSNTPAKPSVTVKKSGKIIEPASDVYFTTDGKSVKISFTSYSIPVNMGQKSYNVDFDGTSSINGYTKNHASIVNYAGKQELDDSYQYIVELDTSNNGTTYPTHAIMTIDGIKVTGNILNIFKKDKSLKSSTLVFNLPKTKKINNATGVISILEYSQIINEKVSTTFPIK